MKQRNNVRLAGSGERAMVFLGLHIASEIAKAHGGTLIVASDDRETRFTFSMPLALPATAA